jgi:hypothetical protein
MKDLDQLRALVRYRLPRITPVTLLRTFPATILLVATVICCGLVTEGESRATYQPTLNRLGIDYDKLANGHIINIFTSTFLQTKPGIAPSMIVVIGSAFLLCELFAGSVRFIVIFFLSDWFATLTSIATLRVLAAFHDQASIRLLSVADAGTSATAHGAYAVAAMSLLPRRLAFAGYGLLLGVTFVLFFEQKPDASMAHLSSSLLGGALGWFIFRPRLLAEFDARGEKVKSVDPDPVDARRPTTDGDLPKTVA